MIRLTNFLLSFTVFAGLLACCCPCGRMPIFQPVRVPVPVPEPQPFKPGGDPQPVVDAGEETVKRLNGQAVRDGNQIVELDLTARGVSDADLKKLSSLTSLRKFKVGDNQLSGSGFKELAGLMNLEHLDVSKCAKFGDAGMKNVAQFTRLKVLNVSSTKIGDTGIGEIAKLDQLEELYASGVAGLKKNEPTDFAIGGLAKLQQLRKLDLSNTNTGNFSVSEFTKLGQLKILELGGTKVTDLAVANLAQLKELEQLRVGNSITDKAIKDLTNALPNCKITKK